MSPVCPQCRVRRLVDGVCIGCGYGFKRVARRRRAVKSAPKPDVKKAPDEPAPWWVE